MLIKCFFKKSTDSNFHSGEGFMDIPIWFKDEYFIQLTYRVSQVGKNDILVSTTIDTPYYVFVDVKNRYFYEYANFSDTATLLRHYGDPDTVSGGTVAIKYYKKDSSINIDSALELRDTIIKGVNYKRFKQTGYRDFIESGYTKLEVIQIAYLDCRRRDNFIFNYGWQNAYKRQDKCPKVRSDIIYPTLGSSSYYENVMIADTLSLKESKVFAAWGKFAKEHLGKR